LFPSAGANLAQEVS